MYLFSGVITEKLFLTCYLLLSISGFYLLLQKIGSSPGYWALVIFFFVFHHTLAKGFYNFSLSTAFYFWMIWSWLRFLDKKDTLNTFLVFCFAGLTFFTQLLPFVFGVFTCFALVVSYSISKGYTEPHRPFIFFVKNSIALAILTAPFLWLMTRFTDSQGGLGMELRPHLYRLVELVQFKYAVCASHQEDFFAGVTGIVLVTFLIACIVMRFKKGFQLHKYDGIFLSLLFVLFVCIFFPEDFLRRVILISMRAQLFVFIMVACCVAYILPKKVQNAGGLIILACFAGISVVRARYMSAASEAVADCVSASRYIRPYSVILPLNINPGGRDCQGKAIVDFNYLFCHTWQYMGTEKPIIFLDNYEALTGYFPLLWTYKTNPYAHLSTYEGIEASPPSADIGAYETQSGVAIDYVLLWCYDSSYLRNEHYHSLATQVGSSFHMVYTSPTARTILFERNR